MMSNRLSSKCFTRLSQNFILFRPYIPYSNQWYRVLGGDAHDMDIGAHDMDIYFVPARLEWSKILLGK
jgi:hypothetical protein